MKIREALFNDLERLIELYRFFDKPDSLSPSDATQPEVQKHWLELLKSHFLRHFVVEVEGKVVSTCVLVLVQNLNHRMKPYALIENVVTDPAYRQKGYGTAVLKAAQQAAWDHGCYKVMLLTGSKKEETLRFYENAGFQRGIKTGFIAYPKKND